METAERIEELLRSEDVEIIQQGLFLLESVETPALLESLAAVCPIEQLLDHDWLAPSWSDAFSADRALAQIRVFQLLAGRCPERPAGESRLEVCLRQQTNGVLRADLDLVDPSGRHATVHRGVPAMTAPAALASASALLERVGLARCADVLYVIGRRLLDGTLPRSHMSPSILADVARHFLRSGGPWQLSMQRLPAALLADASQLEGLEGLRLSGSSCTELPPGMPPSLALDTSSSALEALPRWAERLTIDDRGWGLWRGELEHVTDLTVLSTQPLQMDGAPLRSLRRLRIHASDLSPVLAWLAAAPRRLERLWLGGTTLWAPPQWLWQQPIAQLCLEGVQLVSADLPPAPPPGLEQLQVPADQLPRLPPEWAAIASPIAEGRRLFLRSIGRKKIHLIKVVREHTGLGLRDSKLLVESAPCYLWTAANTGQARRALWELQETGASVELRA